MGKFGGFTIRVRAMTSAGASARDTSSSTASKTAVGGQAMSSQWVAVPWMVCAAASMRRDEDEEEGNRLTQRTKGIRIPLPQLC